jgi:hypothetical protein
MWYCLCRCLRLRGQEQEQEQDTVAGTVDSNTVSDRVADRARWADRAGWTGEADGDTAGAGGRRGRCKCSGRT